MIKYSQIENLQKDHPLYLQFLKEQKELDDLYNMSNCLFDDEDGENEECIEYFNKYMAGDR
jgi:hypothetical protein